MSQQKTCTYCNAPIDFERTGRTKPDGKPEWRRLNAGTKMEHRCGSGLARTGAGGGAELLQAQQPALQQQYSQHTPPLTAMQTPQTNILDIYSTQSLEDARAKIREGWTLQFAFAATAASPDSTAAYDNGENGTTFPTYILVRTE